MGCVRRTSVWVTSAPLTDAPLTVVRVQDQDGAYAEDSPALLDAAAASEILDGCASEFHQRVAHVVLIGGRGDERAASRLLEAGFLPLRRGEHMAHEARHTTKTHMGRPPLTGCLPFDLCRTAYDLVDHLPQQATVSLRQHGPEHASRPHANVLTSTQADD